MQPPVSDLLSCFWTNYCSIPTCNLPLAFSWTTLLLNPNWTVNCYWTQPCSASGRAILRTWHGAYCSHIYLHLQGLLWPPVVLRPRISSPTMTKTFIWVTSEYSNHPSKHHHSSAPILSKLQSSDTGAIAWSKHSSLPDKGFSRTSWPPPSHHPIIMSPWWMTSGHSSLAVGAVKNLPKN